MKSTVVIVVTAAVSSAIALLGWFSSLLGQADPNVWEGASIVTLAMVVIRMILSEVPKLAFRMGWSENNPEATKTVKALEQQVEKLKESKQTDIQEDVRELFDLVKTLQADHLKHVQDHCSFGVQPLQQQSPGQADGETGP